MDNLKARFIEEANDLIEELEKSLLQLEGSDGKQDLIEKVFRAMHTLKGTSSMFGYNMIGELTHDLETIYDYIRSGEAQVTEKILNVTLASVDHLKYLLNNDQQLDEAGNKTHENLSKRILLIVKGLEVNSEDQLTEISTETSNVGEINTYYILFTPKEKILANGANPLFLLDELYALGQCKVSSHYSKIPDLENLDPLSCYIYWDIYLATKEGEQAIKDVFMFVEEDCLLEIHHVSNTDLFTNQKFLDKVKELGDNIQVNDLKEFVNNLLQLIKCKSAGENKPSTVTKDNSTGSIRVPVEKLDGLMNMVSELVTIQASLSLFAEKNIFPELAGIAENVEKISRQLRDNAFSICLIPFENLLTRFQRLVRDLSIELNKDIVLTTEGGDTELDKSIIESLTDPLLHIIRNSIDHAIESPEQRIASKKPVKGNILIKAFYSGNQVHIQVKDDGAGINLERVKAKAIEKGLISADAPLSDKEIIDLVFLPGFSTASHVTEVSGRGVGMDVVKRKISELRGEIEIDSKINVGTTLTIKLPLTMSIIDGLLVKVGDTFFVIPLTSVNKCYELKNAILSSAFNNTIALDGEKVPFFYIREQFNIYNNCPKMHQVVTVNYDNTSVALIVDTIIGEYQAVLKPLGKIYQGLDIMSGGTILGDGTIALVVDSQKIIKNFENKVLT